MLSPGMIHEDKSPCHRVICTPGMTPCPATGVTLERSGPGCKFLPFWAHLSPHKFPAVDPLPSRSPKGELLLPYMVLAATGTAVPSGSHKDVKTLNLLLLVAARAAAPLSAWFP